ncbi:efflux RND transporter periplasmic adaptor subunit [Sungkyunkwania multivorans]|uniref:Efflux RND transporter periplasmic adaptor subunit n=1 Tax=Sungkyunkwania multivorans TaxID=1173618 RepID=A0ABW3D108_9FLAO
MKKIYLITLSALALISCGDGKEKSIDEIIASGDLEVIRAKQQELSNEQLALRADLEKVESAIRNLEGFKNVPLVTTFEAKEDTFKHYLELQGNVQTKQNVLIYPEMAGTLLKMYVKQGDKVRKGQVLAKIDDGGMSQSVAAAEVQTELARTTYERQKRLWEQKIGSEIQYLQAKTTFEAQKNSLRQLKEQLSKTIITAPFSGTIDDVIVEEGTVVAPGSGMTIFRIVNLKDMYIEVDVPEKHLPNVTEGKDVEVFFPVLGKTIATKVRQVASYINPSNRSFKIEVPVPNNGGSIKPNLTAKVRINDYTNPKAILIPQSVISENAEGEQYAYVASDKDEKNLADAKRTIIETGKTQGDLVEVLNGIADGDNIIKEGARSVKNGQKVEVINKK